MTSDDHIYRSRSYEVFNVHIVVVCTVSVVVFCFCIAAILFACYRFLAVVKHFIKRREINGIERDHGV